MILIKYNRVLLETRPILFRACLRRECCNRHSLFICSQKCVFRPYFESQHLTLPDVPAKSQRQKYSRFSRLFFRQKASCDLSHPLPTETNNLYICTPRNDYNGFNKIEVKFTTAIVREANKAHISLILKKYRYSR